MSECDDLRSGIDLLNKERAGTAVRDTRTSSSLISSVAEEGKKKVDSILDPLRTLEAEGERVKATDSVRSTEIGKEITSYGENTAPNSPGQKFNAMLTGDPQVEEYIGTLDSETYSAMHEQIQNWFGGEIGTKGAFGRNWELAYKQARGKFVEKTLTDEGKLTPAIKTELTKMRAEGMLQRNDIPMLDGLMWLKDFDKNTITTDNVYNVVNKIRKEMGDGIASEFAENIIKEKAAKIDEGFANGTYKWASKQDEKAIKEIKAGKYPTTSSDKLSETVDVTLQIFGRLDDKTQNAMELASKTFGTLKPKEQETVLKDMMGGVKFGTKTKALAGTFGLVVVGELLLRLHGSAFNAYKDTIASVTTTWSGTWKDTAASWGILASSDPIALLKLLYGKTDQNPTGMLDNYYNATDILIKGLDAAYNNPIAQIPGIPGILFGWADFAKAQSAEVYANAKHNNQMDSAFAPLVKLGLMIYNKDTGKYEITEYGRKQAGLSEDAATIPAAAGTGKTETGTTMADLKELAITNAMKRDGISREAATKNTNDEIEYMKQKGNSERRAVEILTGKLVTVKDSTETTTSEMTSSSEEDTSIDSQTVTIANTAYSKQDSKFALDALPKDKNGATDISAAKDAGIPIKTVGKLQEQANGQNSIKDSIPAYVEKNFDTMTSKDKDDLDELSKRDAQGTADALLNASAKNCEGE